MKTNRIVAFIATLGILFVLQMPMVSAVSNGNIVNIAYSHNGQNVAPLECKGFVQHVISGAGGSLGTGYVQAYLDVGTEIQSGQAMWGDIIQTSNGSAPNNFVDGMHTAIILENHKNGNFKVIDANYVGKNIVGIHDDFNPVNFIATYPENAKYLQTHYYRLGTTDLWDFNIPTYTQGWEAHNVVGPASVAPDGRLRIDPNRNDPWIQLDGLLLNANNYDAIEINMASNAPNGVGQIYFTTTASPSYDENKRVEFYVINSGINIGSWRTYTIYMKNNAFWKGTITGIRIDPAAVGNEGTTDTDTIGFDWIKVVKTDKKPSITASSLDYSVYSPGNTINFKYWISNPFANDIPDTKLYAAIRKSGTTGSWIEDSSASWSNVVTLSSASYYEVKTYDRAFQLPISTSQGSYDVHLRIFNQNTNDLYDYEYLTSAFTVESTSPIIIDPTPTPTSPPPTPTPIPTATPLPPKPDLIISEVQIIGDAFYSTTKNIGDAPSGSCWTGFYLIYKS